MIDKFDKWFVADWRSFWRWYSTWMHVLGTTVLGVFLLTPTMPPEVQAMIPLKWRFVGIGVWFLVGLIARAVKQGATQ